LIFRSPDYPITRSPDLIVLYSVFMLNEILAQGQRTIDASLEKLLPAATQRPDSIHQAMRHSVFAGGKRLRPILCLEAARMIAGRLPEGVEELGSALEMLHTYSLIHDDLPALDNDDLRRGKPTCHVVFGEALAILAGDALQTQAYEVLARLKCPPEARIKIIEEIARGTGTIDGMIGGQVKDLEAERQPADAATLEYIHRSKTGALITASLVSGGIYAGDRWLRFSACATLAAPLASHSRSWMTCLTSRSLQSNLARLRAKIPRQKKRHILPFLGLRNPCAGPMRWSPPGAARLTHLPSGHRHLRTWPVF
jgi:hypothetical protein